MLTAPTFGSQSIPKHRSLTMEGLAYVGLCLLALALRTIIMAGGRLTPGEAEQALAAYRLAQGSPVSNVGATVSPGLLSLQALAFSLFATNDAWARLPVVVLTTLFPLAFLLLRPMLGRKVSILAALALCLSPAWTALGAQGLPDGLAAVALLFAFAFLRRAGWLGSARCAAAGGAALGLALATSPDAWAALALAALVWLVVWGARSQKPGVRSRESEAPRHASRITHHSSLVGLWRPFALALVVTLLVLATAASFNPIGLQGVLDLPAAWITSFFVREPSVFLAQVLLLLVYEALLVVMGLSTFALATPRSRWRRALYAWTIGTLFLALGAGRRLGGIPLALPALAVLAAEVISLVGRWLAELGGRTRLEGALASGALLGYGYIALAGFSRRGEIAFLVLAITAAGIGIALIGLVWARRGACVAAGLAGLAMLMLLVPWSLSNTVQAAWFQRQNPAELLYARVTEPNLMDLLQDVERLSWSRTRHRTDLPLVLEQAASPLVGWYLRDWRYAEWVVAVPPDTAAEALLTAGTEPPRLESPYVGQAYALEGYWYPYFPGPREFLSWLLYREGLAAAHVRVALWVRDTSPGQSAITLGP